MHNTEKGYGLYEGKKCSTAGNSCKKKHCEFFLQQNIKKMKLSQQKKTA
jgi:hypothetical protein